MTTRFKALFFGTPAFAVPSLDALVTIADVVGVVCQPDRPAGRGHVLTPPPVKARALELGLPIVQPTRLKTDEFSDWVRDQAADVALVVAYGRILPKAVLEGPRLGCVNVHASLLPKYRGAAPIVWAIVDGESETGITLMKLDEGMDTGDTLAFFPTEIGPNETSGELSARLSILGADAVRDHLPRYVAGEMVPTAQDASRASMARMLQKSDGGIDWSLSARQVHNHVRGMHPWPGAFTMLGDRTVKVLSTRIIEAIHRSDTKPGDVIVADNSNLWIGCGEGAIDLQQIQLEGKKPMRGTDWVVGRGIRQGDQLKTK